MMMLLLVLQGLSLVTAQTPGEVEITLLMIILKLDLL